MRNTTWTRRLGIGLAAAVLMGTIALAGCSSTSQSATSSGGSATTGQTAQASNATPPAPPGGAAPGGAPGGGSSAQYAPTGSYSLSSSSATKSGAISATGDDESGVLVTKTGSLSLTDASVTTSGKSKSSDESSFYGLNAGVLAQNGGKIDMTGGSVKTTGAGANGIFAYGTSEITVSGTTVSATGQYAHGIMASGGGSIVATNLSVFTAGGSSAPIATDRGGGTIVANGGVYKSTGNNSPDIYSTGKITANNATFLSTGSEAVVIEGSNSVALNNDSLTSTKAGKWGVMIYQSMSGDAQGAKGVYTQTGGSLSDTTADSPLFYVTNSTAVITLKNVKVTAASGTLINAAAGQWGKSGSNGGTANLAASVQSLTGNLVADKLSSINLTLADGSTLKGAIDSANTAKSATLGLDATSIWTVTADSHLTSLAGAKISGMAISNIIGNGHTVTYDKSASANSSLGGKTYTLAGGGTLVAQ